jgi:outer membrane protein, heavy metal efflux system
MSTSRQARAWIVAVAMVSPVVAGAQERSEREIVELIVREGPEAAAIRAGSEVVRREQLARQVLSNPGLSYSREGAGFAEFVQVEQSLGFIATRQTLSRAGVAAVSAAEAERDARLWLLATEARANLARLRAAESQQSVASDQLRELERLLGILRTREREGEGSRLDRLRAEQELREARRSVADVAAEIAQVRSSLAAMLPAGVTLGPIAATPRVEPSRPVLDALLVRSVTARPDLRALQASVNHVVAEGSLARQLRLPLPSVFAGVKRGDDGPSRRTGGVFGLSVTVPIFDSGTRETARWDAERARIDAARRSLEQQIRSQVAGAFEVWRVRQEALAESDDAGEELLRIAEVAYREGEVGILELLDAVRTVTRARIRHIDRNRDARLAEIALERAVGEVVWP